MSIQIKQNLCIGYVCVTYEYRQTNGLTARLIVYLASFDCKCCINELWPVVLVELWLIHKRWVANLDIVRILLHPMMLKATSIPVGCDNSNKVLQKKSTLWDPHKLFTFVMVCVMSFQHKSFTWSGSKK